MQLRRFVWALVALASLAASVSAQVPAPEMEDDLALETMLFCNITQVPTPDPSVWEFAGPTFYVETEGCRHTYQRIGSGSPDAPALVLIPGFTGTRHNWPPGWVAQLAEHQEVILVDNCGQGGSTLAGNPRDLTIPRMAQQTVNFIAALNLTTPPDILGWSMGGMVAMATAALHGEDVGRVVAIAGSAGSLRSPLPRPQAMTVMLGVETPTPEDTLSLGTPLDTPEGLEFACRFWAEQIEFNDLAINDTITSGHVAAITNYFLATNSVFDALSRIGNEMLLIGGAQDPVVPPGGLRKAASLIPSVWLLVFPNAGHDVAWQYLDVFQPILEQFLAFPVA